MRNNRRTLGIIVVALGLLILALVIYLFFFKQAPVEVPVDQNEINNPVVNLPSVDEINQESTITPGDRPSTKTEYDISAEDEHEINEQDLIKTAKFIAERFGSYSNYSNYSNFSDLKLFMTNKMKAWADNYVSESKTSIDGNDEYFGVTTNAISSKVLDYTANESAVILVSTQRTESGSQIDEGKAYNQDIEITLNKVGGTWLVDSAYWK